MRPVHFSYLAFLVVCYCVFLVTHDWNEPAAVDLSSPTAELAISSTSSVRMFLTESSTSHAGVGARLSEPAIAATPSAQRASIAASEPDKAPSESLSIDYSSRAATLGGLENAAHFAEDVENRLAAVASLQSLAASGDRDGRIREMLRVAATDADARVADAARSAYTQVTEWETGQR